MTVEEAIRARILDCPAVTALVSTRVYTVKLPQRPTLPAVRVAVVNDPRGQHLRGPNGARRGRVQVDAYADEASGTDPNAAANAVASAIEGDGLGENASGVFGWKGSIGSPPFEVMNVYHAAGRRVEYEAAERREVRVMLDYYVWYRT